MDSIEQLGWKVRFRFRTIKKRKRDGNGKARGFYEGKYVYVRVTSPAGEVRDFYCGAGEDLAERTLQGRGRKAELQRELELAGAGGRNGGKKATVTDGDTRELVNGRPDPRQQQLFPGETTNEWFSRQRRRLVRDGSKSR